MKTKLILGMISFLLIQTAPTYTGKKKRLGNKGEPISLAAFQQQEENNDTEPVTTSDEESSGTDNNNELVASPDANQIDNQPSKEEKYFSDKMDWDTKKAKWKIPQNHVPDVAWWPKDPTKTLNAIKKLTKESIQKEKENRLTHDIDNAINVTIRSISYNINKYQPSAREICIANDELVRQLMELTHEGHRLDLINPEVLDNALAWLDDHQKQIKELDIDNTNQIKQYQHNLELQVWKMKLGKNNNTRLTIEQLQGLTKESLKTKGTEFEGKINGLLSFLTQEIDECCDVEESTKLIHQIHTIITAANSHKLPVGQRQMQNAMKAIQKKDIENAQDINIQICHALHLAKQNKEVRRTLDSSKRTTYLVHEDEEELSDNEYEDNEDISHMLKKLPTE